MNRIIISEDNNSVRIVPQRFSNLSEILSFSVILNDLPRYEEYTFDFTRMGFICPFGLLYTSNAIRRLIKGKKKRQIKNLFAGGDIDAQEYCRFANHMGFFRSSGFTFGKSPGTARGNNNYQPIRQLETDYFWKQAYSNFVKPGDIVEEHALKIAKVLLHKNDGDLLAMITWSIREIMRNVVEHSGSKYLEYAAQYWPQKHQAEIAILDNGIGIKESISNNPFLEIESDRDAIQAALLPAVSGKMYKGVKKRPHDNWQNSGYGLYNTSRLCRNGNGSFFISSGETGFCLVGENRTEYKTTFPGTAVRMVLDTSKPVNLEYQLKKYIEEGDEIANTLRGTARIKASTASRMVRTDFK